MGVRADPGSFRWCQALSRSRSFATTLISYLLRIHFLFLIINIQANQLPGQQDAVHITAILGESVIFNCHVEFPGDHPVPYVLQWEKKVSETGSEIPIYIWYENYPTHSGEGYEGRVSRVSADSPFGVASLNLTNIRESDQGWYECKVVFLNRSPNQHKNGTWFHLDVHAPPHFSVTPEDNIYVNIGDSIILNCQADGTPTPEILWYKDANPVDPSSTVGIFNDGTELRISTIRHEDIGDYTCIARNGEGQVSHTARVIIAGGAVIMVPPSNQTKLEGEKATFTCEAKAMPGNVTVRWFREGAPVGEVSALQTRLTIRKDGSLIINPVSLDDSGQYLCEVSNGIGEPQSASAYLNVEYPAKVTFTPTVQYLPFRLAGVVQCYIKANPPLQYVTWTKDKRLLEPYQTKDIVIMNNGSLLFTRVNQNHQGRYTCTPYNAQGTQGSSGAMEVLVRKPPVFIVEPDTVYQRKIGETVEMHCDAQEAEGTQRPNIQWQRNGGVQIQRNRVKSNGGNITIENLTIADYGIYQCVASNEVATITSATQLIIEGTQPHAPYNITGTATESSVTINWMPGYSGGSDFKQNYTIWYREGGVSDWSPIPVTPAGSTQVTIKPLSSGTTYEFQVVGKNELGVGMMSKVITIRTLDVAKQRNVKSPTPTTPTPTNSNSFKLMPDEAGPKPGQPRNLTVTEIANGFLISWQQPLERTHLIQHYTIKYRTDAHWKTLNRGQIRPEETSYLVKNLVGGRTYHFRVLANSGSSYESSDEVKFPVPASVKHKAITAGVVGGILFFIVAIILSICAVKICNKRKRRKQEKAYNMVACRITDARNANYNKTGSGSSNQVPLKKFRKIRIPGIKILAIIIHWIWPPERCRNCQSIYTITPSKYDYTSSSTIKNLDQIHRSADGRFILSGHSSAASTYDIQSTRSSGGIGIDTVDAASITSGNSNTSGVGGGGNSSSSDDGGFLPKRNRLGRTSWRRPLVTYPSQLSFRSDDTLQYGQNYKQKIVNGLINSISGGNGGGGGVGGGSSSGNLSISERSRQRLSQQLLRKVPVEYHHHHHHHHQHRHRYQHSLHQNLHINTISENVPGPMVPTPYTPSRISRIISSSPAVSSATGVGDGDGDVGVIGINDITNRRRIGLSGRDDSSLLWSPHTIYFSDLSSVQQPSSAERSFPSSGTRHTINSSNINNNNINQLRYLQERYSQELPSLRAIHEETQRMAQGFIPLQVQQMHSPASPSSIINYSNSQIETIPEEQMLLQDQFDNEQQQQMQQQLVQQQHQQQQQQAILRQQKLQSYRQKSRLLPRHVRLSRNILDVTTSPVSSASHQLNVGPIQSNERSPAEESRSSSSGFGSKNTSTQQNQSSQSGSTTEWRYLPPYRPPPPPPSSQQYLLQRSTQSSAHFQTLSPSMLLSSSTSTVPLSSPHSSTTHQYQYQQQPVQSQQHHYPIIYSTIDSSSSLNNSPYSMDQWLELINRLNGASDSNNSNNNNNNIPKAVDVGSVDGHYEFDPATPTPTASTPTGPRDDQFMTTILNTSGGSRTSTVATTTMIAGGATMASTSTEHYGIAQHQQPHRKRVSKYDNIEARVQAMKEEFYAYRKRQAMQRAGVELESAC